MGPGAGPSSAPASRSWAPPPAELRLAVDAIHVWRVDLALVGEPLGELLDDAEHERALRIRDARRSLRWRRSRGVLRELLGRYLGCDPRAPAFDLGANGKPALRPDDGLDAAPPLRFNLSHSGELGLYAFAQREVGVDVQLQRSGGPGEGSDRLAIARRSFGHAAARRLGELPPPAREREFLRLWTRYEATLKLRGEGIGGAGGALHDPSPPWIAELDLGPTVAGAAAVAYERAPEELRLYRWG